MDDLRLCVRLRYPLHFLIYFAGLHFSISYFHFSVMPFLSLPSSLLLHPCTPSLYSTTSLKLTRTFVFSLLLALYKYFHVLVNCIYITDGGIQLLMLIRVLLTLCTPVIILYFLCFYFGSTEAPRARPRLAHTPKSHSRSHQTNLSCTNPQMEFIVR